VVHYPLPPHPAWHGTFDDERFSPFFHLALVETALAEPGREGSGQWQLSINALDG